MIATTKDFISLLDPREFKCSHCGARFRWEYKYKRHLRNFRVKGRCPKKRRQKKRRQKKKPARRQTPNEIREEAKAYGVKIDRRGLIYRTSYREDHAKAIAGELEPWSIEDDVKDMT